MKLEPIPNEPALIYEGKKRALILADLHIGIESELKEAGINIPSQIEKISTHLISLCDQNEVDEVVIAGDVKHNVPLTSRQEHYEIPSIFEKLKENVDEVHVTLGNHDGNLKNLLPKWVILHSNKGFVYRGIGILHGHTWPNQDVMRCSQLVMAHQHPTIQFIETLGERDSRQCWVRANFIPDTARKRYPDADFELIIIPTFNELCGGLAINSAEVELLGPILKNGLVDMESAAIYLLDGTFLGKLKDLRV
ncbi:MAG: metallophosphoesterase [Methanomassiliicoccales archaeon]|nr:MAG: metallophosphoesterase [Methanomassiliicoccales archaeon]